MEVRRRTVATALAFSGLLCLAPFAAMTYASVTAVERFTTPPRALAHTTPPDVGLAFEPVAFHAADDTRIAAWWIPAPAARGIVVYVHGYGESKQESLLVAPFLHAAGYHVLALDLRAHGESEGALSTGGILERKDVAAAVQYARSRPDGDALPVALFGRSMGAATSLLALGDLPEVRAVVADSAFASLADVILRKLTAETGAPPPLARASLWLASRLLHADPEAARPLDAVRSDTRPLLLIHGNRDQVVAPDDSRALAAAASGRATLWVVDEADHVQAIERAHDEYEARVLAFLAHTLASPARPEENPGKTHFP